MEIFTEYFFTQGILGVIVIALVVDRLRLQKKCDEKDAKIEELHRLRYDYGVETLKQVTEVMQGNSQNMALLSEKIEVAKGYRK